MAAKTVELMSRIALRILREDKDKRWSFTRFVNAIGSRIGCGDDNSRVKIVVKTLIESDRVNAYTYGRLPSGIYYRTPDEIAGKEREADAQPHLIADGSVEIQRELTKANENLAKRIAECAALQAKLDEAVGTVREKIVEVQLKKGTKIVKKMKAAFHKKFEKILKFVKARKNIFLYGPTGTGKSFICSQVAESLGMDFYFVSCTAGMSEGVLGGRLLPTGKQGTFEYIVSEFIKAYENGGIFLLDEIDACDPNVLLFINAALANGRIAVTARPDAPYAAKHKDFVCIAAANTCGTGGDRMYSGRSKLDGSTLDRFQIARIFIGYDEEVERTLCPDEDLLAKCWAIREAIANHRLERAMSTRFLIEAYDMKHNQDESMSDEDLFGVGEDGYFAGWREDEINKVKAEVAQAI